MTEKDDQQALYVDQLVREIDYWSSKSIGPIGTLYFGGGTPSRLEPRQWRQLYKAIQDRLELEPQLEITAEANPDSLSPSIAELWRELGINRISLGVQSFQANYLNLLDRRHTAMQAEEAIENLRAAGFENWSLDLIYGLPNQDAALWMNDIETALSYSPPHISFYNLILHANLPVTRAALKARREDEDELHADMFLRTVDFLESRAYEVYELSNASCAGRRCLHNSLYWRGGQWIGIGVSASGYYGGVYYSNPGSWEAYLDRWRIPEGGPPVAESPIDPRTALLDTVMLRLRTVEGITKGELESLSGGRTPEGYLKLIAELEGYGYLRDSPGRLALSPPGWLLHSEITNRIVGEIQRGGS